MDPRMLAVLVALVPSLALAEIPHVRQKPDFCGEACAEMVLRSLGHAHTQDHVFAGCGIDPALGRGCWAPELKRALTAIGFRVGPVWHRVRPTKAKQDLAPLFDALVDDLDRGVPSMVLTRYDESPEATGHYRLVVGFDREADEIVYHEPAEDEGANLRMTRERFLDLWPLKYRRERWTVIRFRMQPGEIRPAKKLAAPSQADLVQHVMALKNRLPRGFRVVVEPPFVVVGDEPLRTVRYRARHRVRWAVNLLKKGFFEKNPDPVVEIWLFKDRKSYQKHTRKLFGADPDTPYGYYDDQHRALIMNIRPGVGTLIHEIVHPFMEANFPACPAWFNEGLGSLYECTGERRGQIRGFPNWRLPGLKKAIRAGALPSIQALTATSDRAFYLQDPGTNYAQARFLCYYLQQKKKLREFYREFVANHEDDPTGYQTLERVLEEEDMEAFQVRWEKWVLKLTIPSWTR